MSRTKRDHNWGTRWFAGLSDRDLGRDRKPGSRPPGWWKRIRRRSRRARQKQALRNGKELPIEKKTDVWDWN